MSIKQIAANRWAPLAPKRSRRRATDARAAAPALQAEQAHLTALHSEGRGSRRERKLRGELGGGGRRCQPSALAPKWQLQLAAADIEWKAQLMVSRASNRQIHYLIQTLNVCPSVRPLVCLSLSTWN